MGLYDGFTKPLIVYFVCGILISIEYLMKDSFSKLEKPVIKKDEALPDDYWFTITKNLYESNGEKPAPLQIRAQAIIDAFGLPSGQTSALETDVENNRTAPEKDKVIAELLTNKAGVVINKEKGIVSCDPRDIYPDGLPASLEKALDPRTAGIINTMYKSAVATYEKFGDTKDDLESERSFNYSRLPGGVDLLLLGYIHDRDWHSHHQKFLAKIGTYNPAVIGIEGLTESSPGTSLKRRWEHKYTENRVGGHYDMLMKQLVENGFTGLFTEVDTRDISMISMDSGDFFMEYVFPRLPEDFFKKYFAFLEKEQPQLAHKFGSYDELKIALQKQSTTCGGLFARISTQYKKGKAHNAYPYLKEDGKTSTTPTSLELGQCIFTDALAALKLHMTAKLMADGHIPKGPIVDFEGAHHISSKSFFIQNPEYAAEITLRTINELMAGKVKEKGNIEEIYEVFDNPNWTEIVKEIAKLHFSKVDTTQGESALAGPHQYPINNVSVDFLKIYNIDPSKVMPSDEQIKDVIEKLA